VRLRVQRLARQWLLVLLDFRLTVLTMWAQKFRDCFPKGEPEPDPNAHLQDRFQRVRVGHWMVPPEMVEEYKAKLADMKEVRRTVLIPTSSRA
jgi:hypothetical protein